MPEYYETNLMYHFKEYRKGLTKLFRCSSEHHSEQFRLKMHILYHHLFATDLQNIKTVQSSRCHFSELILGLFMPILAKSAPVLMFTLFVCLCRGLACIKLFCIFPHSITWSTWALIFSQQSKLEQPAHKHFLSVVRDHGWILEKS